MAINTKIEWTDTTWNPVRGCTKISPGCKHCYAEAFAERFRGVKGHPYEQGFDIRLVPERLQDPFLWPHSSRVFVNSMSDLFHPNVPDEYIARVAAIMVEANWHTYQILTKRSERLRDMLNGALRFAAAYRHIWWGVSVENRAQGLVRINAATPLFLSFSNSGEESRRREMAESSVVERTMNSRRRPRRRFLPVSIGFR